MATPIFICGAECGIAVTGTASAGTEHWSSVSGTPTVVTSGPSSMLSTRCFRFNPSAASFALGHTFATAIASPATLVARFYIYFTTLPNAVVPIFTDSSTSTGIIFDNSDNSLRCGTLGAHSGSGVVITTGKWYLLNTKIVLNTTTTADLTVNSDSATQYSTPTSASQAAGFNIGAATNTSDFYIDNIVCSGTSADYPIGPGTCVGLYPNADLTNTSATPTDGNGGHLFSATTDFAKGASGAVATGAQNAESTSWQSLQNPLSTTIGSTWIADLAGASTEHLVWTHTAMPANAETINGVMLVATVHAASATQCLQTMRLQTFSGTPQNVTAWSVLDLSEATITVPIAVMPTAPLGGAWTVTGVNNANFLWGDSTDVTPDPYIDGVCLEVDYIPRLNLPRLILVQARNRASSW